MHVLCVQQKHMQVAAGIRITVDTVFSAVSLVFSSTVCLILCFFQASKVKYFIMSCTLIAFNLATCYFNLHKREWLFDSNIHIWFSQWESLRQRQICQKQQKLNQVHASCSSCHHFIIFISGHCSKATPPSSEFTSSIASALKWKPKNFSFFFNLVNM